MNRIKYQEDEANRIYGRLFEKDGNSEESVSHRYLLADEVGLGKTIVAAMVIAKLAVDRMNKGESVRVAYICSNGALANENIRKLKEKIRSIGKDVYGKEINIDDRSSDRLSLGFRNAWNPPEKKTEAVCCSFTLSRHLLQYMFRQRGLQRRGYLHIICSWEEKKENGSMMVTIQGSFSNT